MLISLPSLLFAQNNTQNIRGVVTDKLSQTPLTGVIVQIASIQKSSSSDANGNFTLSNIPPDRYDISATFLGYKTITIPNVVVTSGKEVIIDIAMEESYKQIGEVL